MLKTNSFKIVEHYILEAMNHVAFDEMDWKKGLIPTKELLI